MIAEAMAEAAQDLHRGIMNIQAPPQDMSDTGLTYPAEAVRAAYREGHRDARHAAAEAIVNYFSF